MNRKLSTRRQHVLNSIYVLYITLDYKHNITLSKIEYMFVNKVCMRAIFPLTYTSIYANCLHVYKHITIAYTYAFKVKGIWCKNQEIYLWVRVSPCNNDSRFTATDNDIRTHTHTSMYIVHPRRRHRHHRIDNNLIDSSKIIIKEHSCRVLGYANERARGFLFVNISVVSVCGVHRRTFNH